MTMPTTSPDRAVVCLMNPHGRRLPVNKGLLPRAVEMFEGPRTAACVFEHGCRVDGGGGRGSGNGTPAEAFSSGAARSTDACSCCAKNRSCRAKGLQSRLKKRQIIETPPTRSMRTIRASCGLLRHMADIRRDAVRLSGLGSSARIVAGNRPGARIALGYSRICRVSKPHYNCAVFG